MRILEMLKKDLKLFKRDFRTVGLIIATPIIIMVILGYIFSGQSSSESIKGVRVGTCIFDRELKAISIPVFELENFTADGKCVSDVKAMVSRGELRAAVIIPANFSGNIKKGSGSSIELYVDGSKTQTAIVASNAMKAFVQDFNEKVGTAFIEEAWENLNELNNKLKYAIEKLLVTKESADSIRVRIEELQVQLNEINSTLAKNYTASLNQSFDEMYTMLNETTQLLNMTVNKTLRDEMGAELNNSKFLISQSMMLIKGTPLELLLGPSITETLAMIDQISANVDVVFGKLDSYENETKFVLANLNEIKASIDNASDKMAYIDEQLSKAEEVRNSVLNEVNSVHDAIVNYSEDIDILTRDLNRTTIVLEEYISKDPLNIVRAVTLDEKVVYGEKSYFEFLSPGLIPVVLLFIILFIASSAVVAERRSGTMARNFLSPTSIGLFLFGKVLYLFLLGIVQIALLLAITSFLGVKVGVSVELLIVAAVIITTFIAVGMLVGAFSKTENTALLTSLVLGIPMLFLSGMFFPFEMMPKFMVALGNRLPLTLAAQLLERIMIYSTGIDYDLVWTMLIIAAACFAVTYVMIRTKPTVD